MTMKVAATISYVGKGSTHNSGLQAADIAVTLAAWIAGYQDLAFADNIEIQMEPVTWAICWPVLPPPSAPVLLGINPGRGDIFQPRQL